MATETDLQRLESQIRALDEKTSERIDQVVLFVLENFQQKIPPEDHSTLRKAYDQAKKLTDNASRIAFWVNVFGRVSALTQQRFSELLEIFPDLVIG